MDADVVIVGAGAAGLAAARELAAKSLRVIVLEARNRVGGRAWTARIPGSVSDVELGAEFIHGAAPETMKLLRECGATSAPLGDDSWGYDPANGLVRDDRDFSATARMFLASSELANDMSVNDFLAQHASSESGDDVRRARLFVEGFDAADPAIASVKSIAAEIGSGTDFTSTRPRGGYGPIFDCLRDACVAAGVEIRLAAPVNAVRWKGGEVRVDCGRGTLLARAALLTVPLGAMPTIAFDPTLPQFKRDALDGMVMGPVVKVCLAYSSPAWETARYRGAAFFRASNDAFTAYWTQRPLPANTVVAWAGGPSARAFDGMTTDQMIAKASSGFAAMFDEPEAIERTLIGGVMHDWSNDPYAGGAYSYVRVGAMSSREALARPIDNTLFFAGEACAQHGQGGTVNGALETGERAAHEVSAARC